MSESSDSSSESEEEEDVHIESDNNGVPENVDTNQYSGEEPRRSSHAKEMLRLDRLLALEWWLLAMFRKCQKE
ncbi:hypothetical protein CTI12_AA112820 [Artemisia annua]|uniref:Uncharacterized protein n=1 Tax=Artemisia annua TaxID=35608 RepID=A0A2U1PU45_ARTAN|nr:hypothetical protein CTI12_AA112820 [Artemisia annua]